MAKTQKTSSHLVPPAKTELLLKKYKIPYTKQAVAGTEEQAVAHAKKLGFPVVMKIISPQVVHKSDAGGVVTDVAQENVAPTFHTLIKQVKRRNPKAQIHGVLLQQQASGRELIVGAKHDPTFGPVLMVGLGGIFVEVLKDVAFRLIPPEKKDVKTMIRELEGYPLLHGVRGERSIHFPSLESTLLKVSNLFSREKIQELDINPLFASPKGVTAADVRIIV